MFWKAAGIASLDGLWQNCMLCESTSLLTSEKCHEMMCLAQETHVKLQRHWAGDVGNLASKAHLLGQTGGDPVDLGMLPAGEAVGDDS